MRNRFALDRKRLSSLAGFSLRAASLGSRFVFVIFAAMWMSPRGFGIYGLVASAVMLITQLAGLEAYQVTLRRVAQGAGDGEMGDERAHYGRFVMCAMAVSAILAIAFGTAFGWSIAVILLAGALAAAEYLGLEAQRILIIEGRSDHAMFGVSLRFLPWNLGLPLLALVGLIGRDWTPEFVLGAWLASSLLGSLFLIPFARIYVRRPETRFRSWFAALVRQVPRWLLIAVSYRFLEVGMRLIPGIVIDEKAAGEFVFYATLASIGCSGLKAAIEPFFFVRMIRPETGVAARRQFAFITLGWLLVAAAVSVFTVWASSRFGQQHVDQDGWLTFVTLLLAFGALSASQVPHFALYAAEDDRSIQNVSAIVLVVSLIVSILATMALGLLGTAIGALTGSALLLGLKWRASAQMPHNRVAALDLVA